MCLISVDFTSGDEGNVWHNRDGRSQELVRRRVHRRTTSHRREDFNQKQGLGRREADVLRVGISATGPTDAALCCLGTVKGGQLAAEDI